MRLLVLIVVLHESLIASSVIYREVVNRHSQTFYFHNGVVALFTVIVDSDNKCHRTSKVSQLIELSHLDANIY